MRTLKGELELLLEVLSMTLLSLRHGHYETEGSRTIQANTMPLTHSDSLITIILALFLFISLSPFQHSRILAMLARLMRCSCSIKTNLRQLLARAFRSKDTARGVEGVP